MDCCGQVCWGCSRACVLQNSTVAMEMRWLFTPAGAASSLENGARVAYNRFAAGFKYDSETLFSRAEYLWGSDNSVQASGGYGLLGYKFTPRLYGFGKYDQLYVQTKEGEYVSETNAITAGLGYRLNSKVLFRLQYQLLQETGTSKYLNNVGGAVTIQF